MEGSANVRVTRPLEVCTVTVDVTEVLAVMYHVKLSVRETGLLQMSEGNRAAKSCRNISQLRRTTDGASALIENKNRLAALFAKEMEHRASRNS